jgi:hypothetical protein
LPFIIFELETTKSFFLKPKKCGFIFGKWIEEIADERIQKKRYDFLLLLNELGIFKFDKIGLHFTFLSLAEFFFFYEWFIQIKTLEEGHWSLPLLKDWLLGFLFTENSINYLAL